MKITKSQLQEIIGDEVIKLRFEAIGVDFDTLLKHPKIANIMRKLSIKKVQSQDAAIKILNYFANNPQALTVFKKLTKV
jgi:hypothetical protein